MGITTSTPSSGSASWKTTLDLRALVRNSGLSYVSTIAVMVLGSLTKILLARSLTPHELGLLLTGQTLAALGAGLVQTSVPEALVRFIGQLGPVGVRRSKTLVRTALWAAVAGSLLLMATVIAAAHFIAGIYRQQDLAPVLISLVIAWPLTTTAIVLTAAYRGMGNILEKILYVDVIPTVSVVIGLTILKGLGRTSLLAVTALYVIAAGCGAVLAIARFRTDRRWKVEPERTALMPMLRYSLPLMAAGLVAWPMAFIPLLLGIRNLEGVAYFNLALALSSLIYTLVSAAETAALPVWASQIASCNRLELKVDYAATSGWCFIAGSAIFALLFLCPTEIIRLMYGERYIGGVNTLRWIAPCLLLNAATGPNESLLKAFGFTRWIFLTRLCVGVGTIVSSLLLWSAAGLTRAVASYWIATLTGTLMYAGYLYGRERIHPVNVPYLKALFSVFVSLGLVNLSHPWIQSGSDLLTILATGTLYAVLLWLLLLATGYTSSEDAGKLRVIFKGVLNRPSPSLVVRVHG